MKATEKRAVFLAICRRTRYSLSVRKALEQMNEPKSRWRGALAGISLRSWMALFYAWRARHPKTATSA